MPKQLGPIRVRLQGYIGKPPPSAHQREETLMTRPAIRLFFAALAAGFLGHAASANELYYSDFDANDGGLTVVSGGNVEQPWVHNGGSGAWSVNGSENLGAPSFSGLRTPPAMVTATGPVYFGGRHRYSFEYDGILWDGGQVRVSVNGGPYNAVPNADFLSGGYVGVIQGNNALTGQEAYNGDSPGYANNEFQVVEAYLGDHPAGTTISVEFLGAWDEFARGQLPNWEITEVVIADTGFVPEPSSLALVAVAAGGLFVGWRRRRAR